MKVYAAEMAARGPGEEPYHFASMDGDWFREINQAVTTDNAAAVVAFLTRPTPRFKPMTIARRYLAQHGASFSEVESGEALEKVIQQEEK